MKRVDVVRMFGSAFLLALTCTAGARWAGADPIYVQRPADSLGGSPSQSDPTGVLPVEIVTFDNFTVARDGAINRVEWLGSYDGPAHEPLQGYTIEFWSDSAGLPGRLLWSISSKGNPFEGFVANDATFSAFRYGTDLGIPIPVSAHTTYWMSIALSVPFPPHWFWRDGIGGDDRSATLTASGGIFPISHDRAFTLFATPSAITPEPGTLALLSAAAAFSVWRRQRPPRESRPPMEVLRTMSSDLSV